LSTSVLTGLARLRESRTQHRPFGPLYMALRRKSEARLRELFLAAGGQPERDVPHYFVLGTSPWFEQLATGMRNVQLSLSALPTAQTSVTWCDSFTAMEQGGSFGVLSEPKPFHGKIFRLDQIPELVGEYGYPNPLPNSNGPGSWVTWPEDAYVEVQLWSDAPIREFLR
jgi:hypothetical protein